MSNVKREVKKWNSVKVVESEIGVTSFPLRNGIREIKDPEGTDPEVGTEKNIAVIRWRIR